MRAHYALLGSRRCSILQHGLAPIKRPDRQRQLLVQPTCLRFESGKLAYLAEGVRVGERVVIDEREHTPAANAIYDHYRASH